MTELNVRIRQTLRYSVYCTILDRDDDYIPDDNTDYKRKTYWDARFSAEPSYDWLGTFGDVKAGYESTGIDFSLPSKRVLVVGCGNSTFSKDLSLQCPSWELVSIDFSSIVIQNMKRKHPELTWIEEDMTRLSNFGDNSFDLVLDKAAMDALVADEGSSWDPSETSKQSVDDMVSSCARVLKSEGIFSIVSFQPIHFRRRHLERAMQNCTLKGENYRWREELKIQNCENAELGTEFAVFTLIKA